MRDAHLGSIWEGTSNIVALDVIRAIRRERSLDALREHWDDLLDGLALDEAFRGTVEDLIARTTRLAEHAADGAERETRRAASALYHLTSAIAMLWEAEQTGSAERSALARLTVAHRLQVRDPLAVDAAPDLAVLEDLLLADQPRC